MYLVVILLCSFLIQEIFGKNDKINSKMYMFVFLLFVFHDGLRWEVGTDWTPYYEYFNEVSFNNYSIARFEIGYEFINKFVKLFTNQYTVFLLFHAIVVYTLIFYNFKKYSVYPILSLYLYYTMQLPYLGANRQFLAFAIIVFSFYWLVNRNIFGFYLLLFVAFLFHKSSLMFVFAPVLLYDYNIKIYVIILSIAILISLSGIVNKLPLKLFFLLGDDVGAKMNLYTALDSSNSFIFTVLSIFRKSIWFFILLLVESKLVKNRNFLLFKNMYFISLFFYLLFNNTILQQVVGRGLMYFNISEIFIIAYILYTLKNNVSKLIIVVLILMYGFINMQKGINYYKMASGVDIFRPYKTFFQK